MIFQDDRNYQKYSIIHNIGYRRYEVSSIPLALLIFQGENRTLMGRKAEISSSSAISKIAKPRMWCWQLLSLGVDFLPLVILRKPPGYQCLQPWWTQRGPQQVCSADYNTWVNAEHGDWETTTEAQFRSTRKGHAAVQLVKMASQSHP